MAVTPQIKANQLIKDLNIKSKEMSDIMAEKGMTDISRVGLYGLTYKENVDDYRESPTLQLLECQRKHLAPELKVYDPYIKADVTANQYHDFDKFLEDTELVVILVGHDEIKNNLDKLKGKIVPEFLKIRKYFKRKKQEKEDTTSMNHYLKNIIHIIYF